MRICWIFLLLFFAACSSSAPLLRRSSPHERYGQSLTEAGLQPTALGRAWFSAASGALAQPIGVSLPYQQRGYFGADQPRAVGLRFSIKRGEKLTVEFSKKPLHNFAVYTELFLEESGGRRLLSTMDTTGTPLSYVATADASLLLRLQPELLRGGEYTLTLRTASSLLFPVSGSGAKVGSVWGDARDGGKRRHEGIDIFAPRGTPAVATGAATVSRVEETGIGGKVVWLRLHDLPLSMYYAHLDSQMVQPGQRIATGETVGTVGNTGNARTSTPHLHFGIYGLGGAIDPLPFVNKAVKPVPTVAALPLGRWYRYAQATGSHPKGTLVWVTDAGPTLLVGNVPDSMPRAVPRNVLQVATERLTSKTLSAPLPLFDAPRADAAVIDTLGAKTVVGVWGYAGGFAYVQKDSLRGWVAFEK